MEKEFIPYDRALRLKALGFNEPCIMVFNYKKKLILPNKIPFKERTNDPNPYLCTAPTFSQAFRWFRKELEESAIEPYDMVKHYSYNMKVSWEEAELACLDKLLEIIESKSE